MKTTIILVFAAVFSLNLVAQRSKPYKVWVSQIDNSVVIKGFLHSADENSLVIRKSDTVIDSTSLIVLDAKNIDILKFRRKGRIGRGLGIGAGAGALFGVIIGVAEGDDEDGWVQFSKEEKAAGAAVPMLLIGAGVGAGVGASKNKIRIYGDIQTYRKELNRIRGYALN